MSAILWWPEIYRAFDLSVPVKVGAGVSGAVSGPVDFGLEVPVSVGMSAAAISSGEFDLAVPVSLGMRGPASADLSVPVSIGMAGSEEYSTVMDLSVPVSIGVAGQFFSEALDLSVPVSIGMAGTPSVTFDAVSAGRGDAGDTSIVLSWSHTASGPDRAVVVPLVEKSSWGGARSNSVTYGGYAMTRLTDRSFSSGGSGGSRIQQFVLLNPPIGQQTVEVRSISTGAAGYIAANSVSYNHVASYEEGAFNWNPNGLNRSLTITGAEVGDMVVQAFGHAVSDSMSGYNRALRAYTAAPDCGVLTGDSAGNGSNITFTATGPITAWAGASVILRRA